MRAWTDEDDKFDDDFSCILHVTGNQAYTVPKQEVRYSQLLVC